MSDLDQNLKELLENEESGIKHCCGQSGTEDIDSDIAKIKEAFKEAGWTEPKDTDSTLLGFKLVYRRSPQLRPEWMVKNGIDYNMITDVTLLPPREEYEAAKRASGVKDE